MVIRFRVWDGEKMHYPEEGEVSKYAITADGSSLQYTGMAVWGYQPIELTTMLSTGLKDKDGREIWEGDVVKYTESYGEHMPPATVVFSDGCFVFGNLEEYVKQWRTCIEIVGNVYENPELQTSSSTTTGGASTRGAKS